jgi:hypothetical protein
MLAPSAQDIAAGVNLFAVLLPWTANVTSIQGIDAEGQVLTSRAPRNPPRNPPSNPAAFQPGLPPADHL